MSLGQDTGQTRHAMKKEENSVRKSSYKAALVLLKVMPMLLALFDITNTTLCFLGIECCWLSFFGGISILSLLFLILFSFVLGFCTYHRMFLYYILVSNIVSIIDYTIGIPVSNRVLLDFHFILFGVFCFLVLHFYLKSRHAECYKESAPEDS